MTMWQKDNFQTDKPLPSYTLIKGLGFQSDKRTWLSDW